MERIRRFFRRLGKGLTNKGYTLIEVACVVAVTATLAAVALPIVKSNVMEAKTVAATENMNNLAGAIQKYYGDTSGWPNVATAGGSALNVLRTSDAPDVVVNATDSGWLLTSVPLSNVLTKNVANRPSWKGPYSSKPELIDPWGHPYYVAIEDNYVVGSDPNQRTAIFVLSAGPDEIIQTTLRQNMQTFTKDTGMAIGATNDDIVLRIR